jgi:hypothetical protein
VIKSSDLNPPVAKFRGKGKSAFEKLKYDRSEKCVYFNQAQYFDGIYPQVEIDMIEFH